MDLFRKVRTFHKHLQSLNSVIRRNQAKRQLSFIKIPDSATFPSAPECGYMDSVFLQSFIDSLCHGIIVKCWTIPAYQLAAVHTHFLQLSKFCINICIACKFDQNSNFHRFCSPSSIISYYTTYTTKISLLLRRQ